MANKQKRKRTKKYQGVDAKVDTPHVMRVSAEERSRLKEWWLQYGQITKLVSGVVLVIFVVILVIVGIVGAFAR